MSDNIIFCIAFWNLAVFVLYGIDKYKAINNRWRISEKVLIGCAFCMGAVGAVMGMEVFRHKTKKKLFRAFILLALLLNATVYAKILK